MTTECNRREFLQQAAGASAVAAGLAPLAVDAADAPPPRCLS